MATYTLTAKYKGDSEVVTLEARNDGDAILTGVGEIMTRAYPNIALWAKGEITLTDSDGVIVQTMAAK
jgi:hypothetical protein